MIIDERGRLTIPKTIREEFGLYPGETAEIEVNRDGILIKPAESHRGRLLKWLKEEHGSEMASLTTDQIMRLIDEE